MSEEKKVEKCEYDPVLDRHAQVDPQTKVHYGCQNEATMLVGVVHNWHLCMPCSDLPRFARMKKRLLKRQSTVEEVEEPA